MAQINWTAEAQRWLEDIFEYLSADNYRITYLVKDDGNVDILGVFHAALDISRYQL
jgi:plasmid stabilization system protein ParE